ncbi:hypothetical protein [Photobacterium damselae]|uniref:hypothetical protein n=1 Tax=Photobacterium damselae TaxID=38293 RepID=UPI001F39CE28|nr:hypothetical protein [Photobacterium damselae]UKA04893.1 hypothetical protein IHC89_21860 [Photobacterium damselae subsp. damselae]
MLENKFISSTKVNLTSVKMIANGLKSPTLDITPSRLERMSKNRLSPTGTILEVVSVSLHELDNIAKLTFFQNKKIGGDYEMSVFITPNIAHIHAKHSKLLSLRKDVKENLLSIKAFIESLYLEYKLLSTK